MSERAVIQTEGAPKAIGPYSQAIRAGSMVFCSGQVGLDPATGELAEGGLEAQVERAFDNIGAVLKEAGASFENVVKTTVFLSSMSDFAAMNEIYARYFKDSPPARSTVEAQLPKNALFEIDLIAVIP